jgi:hypothetical protein
MNLSKLQSFIENSSKSSNVRVKKAADTLLDQIIAAQQAEEITQPTLHAQSDNKPLNDKPKDDVDQQIDNWMPDVAKPEEIPSEFGKAASSFSADVEIASLPKKTQEDIFKFMPSSIKKNKVVQYGMVSAELLPKVDQHNYKLAEKHIQDEMNKNGKKALGDKFQDKVKDKYILLINDNIVDGHHFLALADKLGITCSLKVLDLTPLRFQKTAASLFDKITYGVHNYSR